MNINYLFIFLVFYNILILQYSASWLIISLRTYYDKYVRFNVFLDDENKRDQNIIFSIILFFISTIVYLINLKSLPYLFNNINIIGISPNILTIIIGLLLLFDIISLNLLRDDIFMNIENSMRYLNYIKMKNKILEAIYFPVNNLYVMSITIILFITSLIITLKI